MLEFSANTIGIKMKNVAYIDDNKECLEIVKDSFSQKGIEIDIFDDPIFFYNSKECYKVVISDFHMPILNGQDFLKLLKERDPKTKTIIYSGMVEGIETKSLEIDTFLSKPLDFEMLFNVVRFLMHAYDKESNLEKEAS